MAGRILNVAMPGLRLDRRRIMAVVGELVAAGMAQHVGVRLDAQISGNDCPLDHEGESDNISVQMPCSNSAMASHGSDRASAGVPAKSTQNEPTAISDQRTLSADWGLRAT